MSAAVHGAGYIHNLSGSSLPRAEVSAQGHGHHVRSTSQQHHHHQQQHSRSMVYEEDWINVADIVRRKIHELETHIGPLERRVASSVNFEVDVRKWVDYSQVLGDSIDQQRRRVEELERRAERAERSEEEMKVQLTEIHSRFLAVVDELRSEVGAMRRMSEDQAAKSSDAKRIALEASAKSSEFLTQQTILDRKIRDIDERTSDKLQGFKADTEELHAALFGAGADGVGASISARFQKLEADTTSHHRDVAAAVNRALGDVRGEMVALSNRVSEIDRDIEEKVAERAQKFSTTANSANVLANKLAVYTGLTPSTSAQQPQLHGHSGTAGGTTAIQPPYLAEEHRRRSTSPEQHQDDTDSRTTAAQGSSRTPPPIFTTPAFASIVQEAVAAQVARGNQTAKTAIMSDVNHLMDNAQKMHQQYQHDLREHVSNAINDMMSHTSSITEPLVDEIDSLKLMASDVQQLKQLSNDVQQLRGLAVEVQRLQSLSSEVEGLKSSTSAEIAMLKASNDRMEQQVLAKATQQSAKHVEDISELQNTTDRLENRLQTLANHARVMAGNQERQNEGLSQLQQFIDPHGTIFVPDQGGDDDREDEEPVIGSFQQIPIRDGSRSGSRRNSPTRQRSGAGAKSLSSLIKGVVSGEVDTFRRTVSGSAQHLSEQQHLEIRRIDEAVAEVSNQRDADALRMSSWKGDVDNRIHALIKSLSETSNNASQIADKVDSLGVEVRSHAEVIQQDIPELRGAILAAKHSATEALSGKQAIDVEIQRVRSDLKTQITDATAFVKETLRREIVETANTFAKEICSKNVAELADRIEKQQNGLLQVIQSKCDETVVSGLAEKIRREIAESLRSVRKELTSIFQTQFTTQQEEVQLQLRRVEEDTRKAVNEVRRERRDAADAVARDIADAVNRVERAFMEQLTHLKMELHSDLDRRALELDTAIRHSEDGLVDKIAKYDLGNERLARRVDDMDEEAKKKTSSIERHMKRLTDQVENHDTTVQDALVAAHEVRSQIKDLCAVLGVDVVAKEGGFGSPSKFDNRRMKEMMQHVLLQELSNPHADTGNLLQRLIEAEVRGQAAELRMAMDNHGPSGRNGVEDVQFEPEAGGAQRGRQSTSGNPAVQEELAAFSDMIAESRQLIDQIAVDVRKKTEELETRFLDIRAEWHGYKRDMSKVTYTKAEIDQYLTEKVDVETFNNRLAMKLNRDDVTELRRQVGTDVAQLLVSVNARLAEIDDDVRDCVTREQLTEYLRDRTARTTRAQQFAEQ